MTDQSIKPFEPKNLRGKIANDYQTVKKEFGPLASTEFSSAPKFKLHPDSKRLLGVDQEEKSHIQELVQAEVNHQLKLLREQAYREGFEEGKKIGSAQAHDEYIEASKPKIQQLDQLLKSFDEIKHEMYHANEKFLMQTLVQVAKSVLLKEVSLDTDYLKRLILTLIEKIGAKDFVKIRVRPEDIELVNQLREAIKSEFIDLKNIQIEPTQEIELGGCRVETDLAQINASLEVQFAAIEKSISEA